jgi:hypothetical protein
MASLIACRCDHWRLDYIMFQDIRKAGKTGNQLLAKSLSVDDRGLVTLRARILQGITTESSRLVGVGDSWPFGDVPHLPRAQSALRAQSIDFEKKNGYTYANATYMTAVDPPVVASSESIERLSASFLQEIGADTQIELSFDYYSKGQTLACILARPNAITLQPSGEVLSIFNIKQTLTKTGPAGGTNFINLVPVTYYSTATEVKGDIAFVSVTARTILELNPTDAAPSPPEINPWS